MSVLNKRGEEQCECPLCMEALEVDDLNFFPCTCGYQICRFCWHRIRTDENGLCPACRKAYSENPADFIPLTQEQITALKVEKRQREQQRKAKLSENRKHLANVRVVQKNLVFVVGLPPRLADAEVLKKHEYFGKFGKIHKVVINQSTAYAGSQGPSASAYVTYMKSDDALKAIQNVNNIVIDGRVIKSSLGTTKYCSHFMKNQACPKPDCMYLHDFGDPKASFTKEQMHAGKHQEYERKLHEILLNKMAVQSSLSQQQQQQQQQVDAKQTNSKIKDGNGKSGSVITSLVGTTTTNKENWPQLSTDKIDKNDKKSPENVKEKATKNKVKVKNVSDCNKKPEKSKAPTEGSSSNNSNVVKNFPSESLDESKMEHKLEDKSPSTAKCKEELEKCEKIENGISRLSALMNDNSSFFSQNTFQKVTPEVKQEDNSVLDMTQQVLKDSLPLMNSNEDWEAAFGFSKPVRLDDLAKQRDNVKDTLETFGNSFNPLEAMFNTLDYNKYENNSKLQESLLESLSNKQHTNYGVQNLPSSYSSPSNNTDRLNGIQNGHLDLGRLNGYSSNGLDQHMSKFFNDFCKNGQKDMFTFTQNGINQPPNLNGTSLQNGINPPPNSFYNSVADRQNLVYLQQNRLEEQLMNIKQQQQQPYNQQILQNNGFRSNNHMYNNDIPTQSVPRYSSTAHNHIYQNSLNKSVKNRSEDELDFDPFHETQKGLAELLDSESDQRMQSQQQSTNHLNGLNHGHNHMLAPPPGFVHSVAHMNSFGYKHSGAASNETKSNQRFEVGVHVMDQSREQREYGSKILPYLNMGSSQQQQQLQQQSHINNVSHNNWSSPNNFNSHVQPPPPHKTVDWKMLDPAIMSSSVNYMVPNTQSREQPHFNGIQQAQPLLPQQLQNGPVRSFDFQSYSNFNPQLPQQQQQQTNYNSFSQINNQQNLNWLGNEMNTQIATPPGFRANNQTTKQQEC